MSAWKNREPGVIGQGLQAWGSGWESPNHCQELAYHRARGENPLRCRQVKPGCRQGSPPPLIGLYFAFSSPISGMAIRGQLKGLTYKTCSNVSASGRGTFRASGKAGPGFGCKQAFLCASSCPPVPDGPAEPPSHSHVFCL